MRSLGRTTAVVAVCLLGACPGLNSDFQLHYFFLYGQADVTDVGGSRFTCEYGITLKMDSLPTNAWNATPFGDSVLVARTVRNAANVEQAAAGRNFGGLQVAVTYPHADSIEIVVSGPFADTLRGHRSGDSYTGVWLCPPTVPLGADPAINAKGYDASVPMAGNWFLTPDQPVG